MDRRQFSSLISLLVGSTALSSGEAQTPASTTMPPVQSGVFPPGKEYAAGTGRTSQRFLTGMLNPRLRLEAHETVIEPGAPPEDTRKHPHNEIWLMKDGTVELWAEGKAHTMHAGDLGLVVAGDMHYVKNIGAGRASYFVLAVGPPE